jgi:hypothetical protein
MAKRNGGSPFIVALIDPPISNKSSPCLINTNISLLVTGLQKVTYNNHNNDLLPDFWMVTNKKKKKKPKSKKSTFGVSRVYKDTDTGSAIVIT